MSQKKINVWKRKEKEHKLKIQEKNGVTYLTFPVLASTGLVKHSFSTRLGGVSEGKFSTMNFTFTRGDNPEHVKENYRRMGQVLEVDPNRMVLSYQTHTTNVRVVKEEDAGKGIVKERDYKDVDGLVTNVPGITLVTFYADCVPLYVVDPIHKAIGLSHSGWRGTVARMGQATLDRMQQEYGTRAEDVIVCIGPSICQDCFEVGQEVVLEFEKAFGRANTESMIDQKESQKEFKKYQLDLWKANELVFLDAGVKPENIHVTDICTHCNPALLFSHRSAGNERGNLAAFLALQ